MTTKYIISVRKQNLMASKENALKHYIMACGKIELIEKFIKYDDIVCNFEIKTFDIEETDIIVYQVIITNDEIEPDYNSNLTKTYASLLRILEKILGEIAVNFEVVWDDLAYYCSKISYPLIYEIENQMRMLITKFMLINVGSQWSEKEVPSTVKNSQSMKRESNKRQVKQSIVYKLDFIELADVLFKAFPLKEKLDDLKKQKDTITWDIVSPYVPMSNWDRYFKAFVNIESEKLKKIWGELYEFRCSIAHNKRISLDDVIFIKSKIQEIAPSIEKAIDALDEIAVPKDETEKIAEAVITMNDVLVGKFLNAFEMFVQSGNATTKVKTFIPTFRYHDKNGLFTEAEKNRLMGILNMRNNIVHCVRDEEYTPEDISSAISFLNEINSRV